ncbi:MAG TPA: hypothetical protein VNL70_01270 [Tepidisphaeraceae bacterium]|nr:hypothetical protein [Tepidisphaeraceae bacterium]
MIGTFAYSFDRETFHGSYATRQEALKKALEKLPEIETTPEAIYVGKRVPIDVGSSGLAEMILAAMRRRVREQNSEEVGVADDFLMRVNEHQLAELDDEIDRVIRAWLVKHELMPRQDKIVAISEHPIPQPSMVARPSAAGSEVGELGESEYPFSLL